MSEGIDYPYRIKKIADDRAANKGRWDDEGNPVRINLISETIILSDVQYKKARSVLKSFIITHDANNENVDNRGWSMIRQYKKDGTCFQFATDPIAPDTVVVKRKYLTNNEGEIELNPSYYWVSDRKGNYGEPLIFVVNSILDKEKIPDTHFVSLVNTSWGSKEETKAKNNSFFACKDENYPQLRYEFDVWKRGKSLTEKSNRNLSNKAAVGIDLTPKPVPIPIPTETVN